MIRKLLILTALIISSLSASAFSNDILDYETYYNYDTGFYDTRAVLYDTDNDWFYDYYVVGPQKQVEYEYNWIGDEYEWEIEDDIF